MRSILERAVKAYYGYDIETYQLCISELENRINREPCECRKCAYRGEYELVCSLVYLNMPKKLCEFYAKRYSLDIKTVRIPYLYSALYKGDFLSMLNQYIYEHEQCWDNLREEYFDAEICSYLHKLRIIQA